MVKFCILPSILLLRKYWKNPAVGCILVNNNKVVGIGSTSANGRPHAEENAIEMAGKEAVGSTIYITLEPCNLSWIIIFHVQK